MKKKVCCFFTDLHVSTSTTQLVLTVFCCHVKGLASTMARFHSHHANARASRRASASAVYLSSYQLSAIVSVNQGHATPSLLPSNATQKILNTYTLQLPRREAGGDPQRRGVAQKYCFLHVGITNSESDECCTETKLPCGTEEAMMAHIWQWWCRCLCWTGLLSNNRRGLWVCRVCFFKTV